MKFPRRMALASALILAATGMAIGCAKDVAPVSAPSPAQPAVKAAAAGLPRLVDLGAGKCIPCKAMAPILEGLKTEYAGRMDVQFIDVWKDPDAGKAYGIRIIPTQIFYGPDGKELARHQGFMDKEAILAQWKAARSEPLAGERMGEILTAFGNAFACVGSARPSGRLPVGCALGGPEPLPPVEHPARGRLHERWEPSSPPAGAPSSSRRSFAVGILGSIAVIGVLTAAAGRMAGDVGRWGTYALAAVFFAVGLNLIGMLPLPTWSTPAAGTRRRGPWGALVLGLVFGAALGPCTFAFMAPLLGLAFRSGAEAAAYGALLVAVYGLGHGVAIVAAGVSAQSVQRWLGWKTGARAATVVAREWPALAVIAGGVYFLYTAT